MSDFDILRRIADRGLNAAQRQMDSEQIDLWTHMLDEIGRAKQQTESDLFEAMRDPDMAYFNKNLRQALLEEESRRGKTDD